VQLRFLKSPYGDFLFYLLYRQDHGYKGLARAVPLDDVPEADERPSLPEVATSRQVQFYQDLYPLLEPYRDAKKCEEVAEVKLPDGRTQPRARRLCFGDGVPSYEAIFGWVKQGESRYPAFYEVWSKQIAPDEDRQLAAWRQQDERCHPMQKLQEMERLKFTEDHLDVGALALHDGGSALSWPAGVYSGPAAADLGWVLGGEGTRLLIGPGGWRAHPLAARAVERVKKAGGEDGAIEDSLSLFMQVKLSRACGGSADAGRGADRLKQSPVKAALVRSMEDRWPAYEASRSGTIIDFMLESAIAAFGG
jgi:hypothetical protein